MAKKDETKKTKEQQDLQAKVDAEAKAKEEEAQAKADAEAKAKVSELVSVNELANKLRIPSWQSAAINRLMGWERDKQVTEKEYLYALERLSDRRIGG